MRPPSYYTSLANSNSNYRSSNSSQQLRSSFASASSTSYATRTHLPFAPQTMLVAHCYTGVGSSTKPYGQPSSSVYSSSRYSGGGSSSGSYSSTYSSRPPSTKRLHLPTSSSSSPSSSSSTYTPRSSYLSSGSGTSTSSSYRRPSYTYQPIRLRERPLLTRISNQISSRYDSPVSRDSSRPPSGLGREISKRVDAKESSEPKAENGKQETEQEERDWSSDVARNISRNKYLIKFREFDKPRSSIVPDREQIPDLREEERTKQTNFETREGPNISVTVKLPTEEEMRLPTPPIESNHKPLVDNATINEDSKPSVNGKKEKEEEEEEECDSTKETIKKVKTPKERRNIKLKIKNVNSSANKTPAADVSDQQPPAVVIEKKKKKTLVTEPTSQETSMDATAAAVPTTPTKTKVKRVVKRASKVTAGVSGEVQPNDSVAPKSELKAKDSLLTNKLERKVLAPKQFNSSDTKESPKAAAAAAEVGTKKAALVQDHAPASNEVANKRIRFREYNHDDFNFLSVLGHGGWGFVILAELKNHDACFAVKCIKKITIVEDDDFDSIMIERKVLTLGNIHPFICKLFCTFETEGYLFFAMEYCAGGDLMFHVQREGKFTEARSRFYAAEIICAIRFLHNQHIIYRDLKLDNILLDSRGHVRLVDFGMCQCRTYREEMLPSNFCGTPEYISPEIIKGVPYNHSVDWWSFGVLLYEMAVGKMPFRGNDENELLWNVCYEQIHYPMFLTKELTSLLQSLLEREPTKRMGMSTCKAGDIYDQPWFKGVDWRAIEELRVAPPFVPDVTSERDVQNFDSDFTQSTPELSPVDESTLKKIDQSQFQKFPYTNPNISIFG